MFKAMKQTLVIAILAYYPIRVATKFPFQNSSTTDLPQETQTKNVTVQKPGSRFSLNRIHASLALERVGG